MFGHHRDLSTEEGDGPVGFISLDDEPTCPDPAFPELRTTRRRDPRWIQLELLTQDVRDHCRRRRLAVCAADDDRRPERHRLGRKLGPRTTLDPGDVRGRDHDLEGPTEATSAAWVDCDLMSVEEDRRGSQPRTSAPHAREKFAYAERPAPPIPTK
jgi:hypothetical protein